MIQVINKNILILFSLGILGILVGCNAEKTYYAFTNKVGYDKAIDICHRFNLTLATVESELEQKYLEQQLIKAQIDSDISETFLIDATKNIDGTWKWKTTNKDINLTYFKWIENDLESPENWRCLAISKQGDVYGWRVRPCYSWYHYHFLCQGDGCSIKRAATHFGVDKMTIIRWKKRWIEDNTTDRKHESGRQRVSSEEQDERLTDHLRQNPFSTSVKASNVAMFSRITSHSQQKNQKIIKFPVVLLQKNLS